MEIDNTSQNPDSAQPSSPQKLNLFNSIINQRGNFLIIIGIVVVLLLVVGGIGYVLTTKKAQESENNQTNQSTTSPTATQNSSVKIADWNTFKHPSGNYSFQYPPEIKITEGANKEITLNFTQIDSHGSSDRIMMWQQDNIYNRTNLDTYLKRDSGYTKEGLNKSQLLTINGAKARRFLLNNDVIIYIQYGQNIYFIHYFPDSVIDNHEENIKTLDIIVSTLTFIQPTPETKDVKIIDGDIYTIKEGKETKITSWEYNSSPILSPDKSKVAYISKSAESIENEKNDQGYKRTSTNVWIVNADGTNPVQVTKHGHFVYRSNLHWLDNDRLIFMDGEETARVYNFATKSLSKVFGPEQPVGACVDACGFVMYHSYSPDFGYLVSMAVGYGDRIIRVANTKTLTSFELQNPNGPCMNSDSIKFSSDNKSLVFKSNADESSCNGKSIEVNVNLETQKITTN